MTFDIASCRMLAHRVLGCLVVQDAGDFFDSKRAESFSFVELSPGVIRSLSGIISSCVFTSETTLEEELITNVDKCQAGIERREPRDLSAFFLEP